MIRQLLLLGILMDGKMHGYQLNEYIKHTMGFYTDLKKSTAYYILDQMEKEGYVSYETERKGRRPERRVYEITEQGKTHFHKLLRDCLGDYTQKSFGDDIGVAFIDKLTPAEIQTLLEGKRQKIVAMFEEFKELKGHRGGWKHVINHNIAHLKADLSWVDNILKERGKES